MTKAELIKNYRDINVDHFDWWDCTYDRFTEDMATKHINVDRMQFSGFWSQGDGASFTGHISGTKAFIEAHDLTKDYPVIMRLLSHGGDFDIRIVRTGYHYVHENSVEAEISNTDMFHHVLPGGDVREPIIHQWDEELDAEYGRITEDINTVVRGYCRDLYDQLEEEYEYLTSDEAVWEAIEVNELDKQEEETV